jgi:predicted short-subunit dehydrogenase-like oxidoreductase (DUF2520 family)
VPDAAVSTIADQLARADLPQGVAVMHVSGALGLDSMRALKNRYMVGSFHPLQSFPRPRGPEAFRGALIAIDATTRALLLQLARLARDLGARPRRITDDERALYHAAAAFASNYLIVLLSEAVQILREAGWSERESVGALLPLMEGVMQNVSKTGIRKALTGPISRGDVATVQRHLEALAKRPQTEAVYRMLGAVALEIAEESGLDSNAAGQMRVALTRKEAATQRSIR